MAVLSETGHLTIRKGGMELANLLTTALSQKMFMRKFKLLKDVHFFQIDGIYAFDDQNSDVFGCDEHGKLAEYPLRPGLAGYLWLLLTEDDFFEKIND